MRNVLAVLAALCFVAACGNRGPLFFPESKPPSKQAAKPATQSSADAEDKK
jgi:predicted small lipoprotein YifL